MNYCHKILYISCFLFLISFTSQAQTKVYDYMSITIDPSGGMSISESGKEAVFRKIEKKESKKGLDIAFEIIKERNKQGWEWFDSAQSSSVHIFYLRREDKEATKTANE